MKTHPNVIFVLCDQLRARSTPPQDRQVSLPGMQGMIEDGITMRNALSTYPICTPYRGMFLTGRHPQTTGMFVNFTSTRSSEIGLGDAFKAANYRTGYVGKWHLNRGGFPNEKMDWIPEGRARLGFDYWRAYNCHVDFWDGHVNGHDWEPKRWKGYETQALLDYVREFLQQDDGRPSLLVLSVHQPHWNWAAVCAPQGCYDRVPENLTMPDNVPEHYQDEAKETSRHYLAMTIAVDDMLSEIRAMADEDTIVIFTSDHGTMMGSHAYEGERGNCWGKSRPQEESINVPFFAVWPGKIQPGSQSDELLTPVDIFPTLCGLCGVPIPRTVEGLDLSAAFRGEKPEQSRDAAFIMNMQNYAQSPNYIRLDGNEWRGVRTHTHTYAEWSDGSRMLFDNAADPYQLQNLSGIKSESKIERHLATRLRELMAERGDALHPSTYYRDWIDHERRIVRNAFGPLSHPDTPPDWSLLS